MHYNQMFTCCIVHSCVKEEKEKLIINENCKSMIIRINILCNLLTVVVFCYHMALS